MAISKAGFDALPVELLTRIRSHIHSLKALVAFSQLNKASAGVCDEEFWHKACVDAGFSRPVKTSVPLPSNWTSFARVICADSKNFVALRETIGGDNWVTSDAVFENAWTEDLLKIVNRLPAHVKAQEQKSKFWQLQISGHEVSVDWTRNPETVWKVFDVIKEGPNGKDKFYEYMALRHPYVFCRIVCKPLASVVYVSEYFGFSPGKASNPTGVVYGDVMRVIAPSINAIGPDAYEGDHTIFDGFTLTCSGTAPRLDYGF